MEDFRFGDDYHNGHTFALPRKALSKCLGCGQTWSKIISNCDWCPEPEGSLTMTIHPNHLFCANE